MNVKTNTILFGLCASLSVPLAVQAQVGFTQIKSEAGPVTLVYPTDQLATPQNMGAFNLAVAFGAKPARLNGRLIVMSHGSGGSAVSDHDLARTLALAGFVVAQPEHRGDNWRDMKDLGPLSWERRPREVSQAIDAIARLPDFSGALKLDKVGVHGMSAGGVSALSQAGATWTYDNVKQYCRRNHQSDPNFCFYGLRTPAEINARMAEYLKPGAGDEDIKPRAYRDPRVAAVTAMVPVGAIFDAASLAKITVPTGLVIASADEVLLPGFHAEYILKNCPSCTTLIRLEGAGHFDTLSPWPAEIARKVALDMPGGALGKNFKRDDLGVAFARITAFFVQNLVQP